MLVGDETMAADAVSIAGAQPKKLAIGTRFAGRYDIEALLGEGGMGAVYRARDRVLAEVVALKVLTLPVTRSREYAEMFRQEVKLSRRITHANVVHVYDIGEDDSFLYMTMELIEGITLRRALNDSPRGRLPFVEAIRIACALANGLAAVHGQGIVHRDLKPGNVMIGQSGRVVLADFGIARHIGADDPAAHGRIIGTISYMAPEQFAQSPPSLRTDLYSFGLVFLEALTGALPPRCDGWLSSHRKQIEVNLDAAGIIGKPVEVKAVENLVRSCLDNDPSARPESAEEVARELNALLSHEKSQVDLGAHSVDRANTGTTRAAHLPVDMASDRMTFVVADIMTQGIPEDVAQDYVSARHESRLNDPAHLVGAFERLDSCVQRMPNFQQAIASRAVIAVRCWFFDRITADVDWGEVATKCVDEAIRFAPDLSDTHLAMGMLTTQNCEMKRAVRSLIRAVEIDPASHEAQEYLGGIEIETGLIVRGVPRLLYAKGLLPPRPLPCMVLARCYALLGRFDESEPMLAESHRRTSIPTLGHLLYTLRIHSYRWGKRPFHLTISQRKAVREKDWIGVAHYIDALAGTADARVVMTWMDGFLPEVKNRRASMVLRQVCAELCLLLGLEDKAYELLADCARAGLIDILWVDRCPLLASLRMRDGFGEIRDWVWLNAYGVWN